MGSLLFRCLCIFAGLAAKSNRWGQPPASWLGIPLKTASEVIGVLVVQHYVDTADYSKRDLEFLTSVGGQIGLAIERKQTERELRDSEKRLIEAQHTALLGNWDWDIATNKTSWSEALYRIYGVQPENCVLSFEGYLSLVHPDDRQCVSDRVKTNHKWNSLSFPSTGRAERVTVSGFPYMSRCTSTP